MIGGNMGSLCKDIGIFISLMSLVKGYWISLRKNMMMNTLDIFLP